MLSQSIHGFHLQNIDYFYSTCTFYLSSLLFDEWLRFRIDFVLVHTHCTSLALLLHLSWSRNAIARLGRGLLHIRVCSVCEPVLNVIVYSFFWFYTRSLTMLATA